MSAIERILGVSLWVLVEGTRHVSPPKEGEPGTERQGLDCSGVKGWGVLPASPPKLKREARRRTAIIKLSLTGGVVVALAEVAVEMRVEFAQATEARNDVGAHRANEHPVHVE